MLMDHWFSSASSAVLVWVHPLFPPLTVGCGYSTLPWIPFIKHALAVNKPPDEPSLLGLTMASSGAEEEDEGISLDIDDMHMLLHVEQEQIQKRTFTNWINAQLAKRSPPSRVSDLFVDLKDGSILLELLEVITGQPMTRHRIHGVFKQRADIETALDFLKSKSVKLVNINVPDIIDGKPAVILGLIWTIILHFHIEEMAISLSSILPPSSLDSLDRSESSLSTQPSLQKSFGQSAKQALLTWAQNQCHRVGCSVSITDFTSSWRSGEAFLAILCSLRPDLVDLTQVQTRTNLENLERAFELSERELHVPRLLEPHDVDVPDPDEKSIMTFVAQFLQFSVESTTPVANTEEPNLSTDDCKNDIQYKKGFREGPTESQKAKCRLEKTRVRVQARIQQVIKLFSNRDITEAEAKRKERALKALQPDLLEDFLSAVDTFGAFCSEPQLQDLKSLSGSVKKQWEDVRVDMSAYIDMLWCKIRERKMQESVEPCKRSTAIRHEEGQQKQEMYSVRSWRNQDGTDTTTNLQSKHQPTAQQDVQSAECFTDTIDKMESADDKTELVSEILKKMVSKPFSNISSMTRTEPSGLLDSKVDTHATNMEVTEERLQIQEDKQAKSTKVDVFQLHQQLDLKTDISERVKHFKIMENENVVETKDKKIRKRTSDFKPEESFGQRRMDLLGKLMELQTTAEELSLQEVTLPALHQRSRALMKLENSLSGLHSEYEHIKNSSQSESCDISVNHDVEHLWQVTTKAVSERLEQCGHLAELLKRFQKTSAEVGETLQRAESTVKEQASYMGRENLHRLHTKVIETKSELNNLGDRVGELRSVSKQLHSHLQQIPQCPSNIPFESEAQSLMDHWIDISERVELYFENVQFALSLWDGALKLGLEVEHWTSTKFTTFAHSPFFQSEEDIQVLQAEVKAQQESIKCFSRITTQIQALLQTAEPPLELQVGQAQMRKRMDELQELVSEAEEFFRQTEAAKANVCDRMTESLCSLHTVQKALLSLSGPDPPTVLSQLRGLFLQLQVQDEQVQALHEDLGVLLSVGRPDGLESVFENGHKLQETLTQVHQLYSEVEEQTHRDIQLYDRLQTQVEHFKQWLNTDELTQDPRVLQEEVVQHRVKDLSQLVLFLRNSTFQKSVLIEESGKLLEQYYKCESSTRGGPKELHESLHSQSCVKAENQPQAQVSEVCGVQRGPSAESPAGDSLTCARGSVVDMKDGVQETEDNLWLNSGLQVAPKLNNNMREDCILHDSYWFELESCLSLLKAQLDEVSITGEEVSDDEDLGRLLQDCCHKLTSLQGKVSKVTTGSVQEVVLQQLAAIEKVLCQRVALMDPNNSLTQEIHNLLHLKRALDDSIKDRTGQEQKQRSDQHMEEQPVSNEDSFKTILKSFGPGNLVIETGVTNGRGHMQQISQIEQNEPPTSHQRSPGLKESISVDKEDHAASHFQPSHSLQNEKKIEIQEPLNSEENAISAAPGNDPKRRPQTQNLVTCPADVLQNHSIVQERAIHGKLNTGCNASVEEIDNIFKQDNTDFCNTEDAKVGTVLHTVDIKILTKNTVPMDIVGGNIEHVNEDERLYFDSISRLLKEVCRLELPESSEDTSQMALEMEPEKTNGQGDCCVSVEEVTGEEVAGESFKHKFTMEDVLEGVQSLVENSCIINREPRLDLKWFLNSLSSEAEIQLMQTIQRVFVCHYQSAQSNLTAMATQLREAEKLKCCVQEKVDAIKSTGESDVPNCLESLCSAALLDASATVQVKAAQLEQVKQYLRQLKMIKALLEVVTTQKETMNLDTLGSSERLAEQLNALFKTMNYKKCLIEDLVKLSRQLARHLSYSERFGVLRAQISDIQREWTLLEQNIKTALSHASNSASQLSAFRQETKALKNKLEELFFSLDSFVRLPNLKNTWYLLTWTADLKMYTQQYEDLSSRFDDIAQYTGQRDTDVLKKELENLGIVLNETKMKHGIVTGNCVGILSNNVNMQLQEFIVWAKQVECHIITGEKLALFPEEARIQIAEMEKFQSNILCRQAQIQKIQFQEIKTRTREGSDQVCEALVELYQTIFSNLGKCVETMKDNLKDREALFSQLAGIDVWLAEIHNETDSFGHVENIHRVDLENLEKQSKIHLKNVIEIEGKCELVDALEESCKKILVGLSPGEGCYLVNRLAGIRTEICGVLVHEKAVISELEELMNLWTICDDDLSKIETNLQSISIALNKQRFPLTLESISEIRTLKYKLTEHQCQVQVMQHCKEAKRTSVLDTIGELLDRCSVLSLCAIEQDKYVRLRRQMEQSKGILNEQILNAKDNATNLGEKFQLCQHLLVELPLVKTQCQEVADQSEAIAQELYPSELNAERQMIRNTVEILVKWENSITEDIKKLENQLRLGLCYETEVVETMGLMLKTKQELEEAKPVDPDEKAIDVRLQENWVRWRNMESTMRVLEGLARKEKKNLRHHEELYAARNAAVKECLVQMESLAQARESLKDYQWAAQGAAVFLHNAETTFLSSSGGFVDCTEEQRQTQQALDALQDGFNAHVDHLTKAIPQQPCLSRTEMEVVHSEILGQLLVRRAVLEAQAQLRLEALQRCSEMHQQHMYKHGQVLGIICGLEDSLSKCTTEHITSYEACLAQLKRIKLLLEDLQGLAGQIKELGAGCPMHGCGAGRAGEVSSLWKKWTALRRGVGHLLAHTELKAEEWKNITTSIEQCSAHMASLQTGLPLCSPGGISEGGSLTLLAQAELHHARLEMERRALASLEQRLEHALSPSHTQAPISPGALGKTLLDIRDSVRSLIERTRKVVETEQLKEKKKQQIIQELTELENHVLCLSSTLESSSSQSQQEYKKQLSSHNTRLQHILDRLDNCYSEIPLDIYRLLQDIQLSLQRAADKVTERSAHVERLSGRVEELSSGLERVRDLLKRRSPSVTEAQNALKHVWDELELWHGRLMLLESEVQDLAEDLPDQAHVLMDQLTEPLQCYQDMAQMVEQHTAFVSKIPACLREFDNILYRATCWLEEAESWLGASCSFTTAKTLQNHASSLQLLLEDSERIRVLLQEFRPVLCDIRAVCDITVQELRLEDTDRHVLNMQQTILQPLGALLQAATVVENLEAELKTTERNVSKMEAILSLEENGNTSITEHLHNRQVIVSSAQSAKQVLRDMQRVKEELDLPWDFKDKLLVWSKASALSQQIQDLELLSQKQANALEREACSEEDEDDGLSSSDTLTSSLTEDPDEMIRATDLPTMDEEKQLANVEVVDGLPFEQDTSLDTTESWLLSIRPWLDTSASEHMESDLNFENATCEPPVSADVPTVGNQTSFVMETSGSPKQEVRVFASTQARSGLEDTRVVPVRPITPFAAAAVFEEEEDGRPSLSASPTDDLDTSIQLKQIAGSEIPLNERYEEASSPKDMSRSKHREENGIEQPSWTQMADEISQMLFSLDKQNFQISEGETVSSVACLQSTQQAVLMLRPIVNSSGPCEHGELFKALKQVLLSLDALSKLVLTSAQDKNDPELKLLQDECLRGELVTLYELLKQIERVDKQEISQCVTSIQKCVRMVSEQMHSHMGLTQQQQVLSNHVIFMDYLHLKQNSKETPDLLSVLVGHLRRSPGAGAELRQASQSMLQGMRALVEVGEEGTVEGQKLTIHSQTELQAALQRLKKLQEVLVSQLAFTQHIFQEEALKCHEDEWAQLQVRARALQQQALDQLVTFQWNLQEWTQWEDYCGQLGRLLDESEDFLSREELNGSGAEEMIQQRMQGCREMLSKLDKTKATLGLLLDQGENLQAASVRQKGGALELQWRDVYRRTEGAINRCRDMQEHWASFQTDVASLNKWLHGAEEQVQTCTDLSSTSDLKLECVRNSLITMLDLSIEVGAMSALKASVCRRSCPCPREREQLTNLETQWSELTSALCNTQEQLQQHLLKRWPHDDILSALEDWLEKKQTHFNEEKEKNSVCLQQLKGLKSGLEHGQLLLDGLCQSGPPLVGDEAVTLRSERTMLAEKLGALRLRWVNLQGELEIQINGAEHMHQIQAQKQKKLQHLQNFINQKKTELDHLKRPCGEVLARRILLEWEGHVGSLKDVAADVDKLKNMCLNIENEMKDYTGDAVFSEQVEVLRRNCEDIIQQMETLHPSIQQTVDKWSYFKKHLNEISLYTVRLHCSLQQLHAPVFSLQEAEKHLLLLQEFQLTTNKYEDLWDDLEKSCQDLVKSDLVAADVLKEEMERQRQRWNGVLQDLKNETEKTQNTLSIWQEFSNESKNCSLQLQQAWSQWEELHLRQDTQARPQSIQVQKFQEKVESVESTLERVLAASKLLIGQLGPMASNIVQSQTSQLSHDVWILSQTLQVYKKNTQDDIDQLNVFLNHLERLENHMKEKEDQINRVKNVNGAEQVFQELSNLFSSMFDISEMSSHVNLSNQEAQRLHQLQGRYVDSQTRGLEQYKRLHSQHHDSLDFDEKYKALTEIQDKLEQESAFGNLQNYNNLKNMAAVHQRLQGDIVIGHQLLHGLMCDAIKIMKNGTETQRSESFAKVSYIKQKWTDMLNLINQRQSSVKYQLSQYSMYQSGLKHLYNVIREIDSLLPPTRQVISVSRIEMQDYEAVEKALQPHSAIYSRTVDTGRSLCKSLTDAETQLQTEVEALEEAWERATSQLERHKAEINNTVQKWRLCQKSIAEVRSELDQCGLKLKKAVPAKTKDVEKIIQETEFSLQHLRTGGLQEVDTMKTDLSRYLPLGDSALLEQQLEQLHSQWEELCAKVSLRKQEIADRLNAWTIFNDKNKEFCDWLTQMENKVCHSTDLSFEEMVEKLKKDCMEEINLFSENKRHLKQLGEQLLWASDEAKHSQVHGSLQEANQRWQGLFHHIQDRVKKLKETLAAVQQLDKNMSNLRSWLCRIEAELSRPITYSVLHHQEIHKRLAEHQELQRDIEQHTEGVVSVLSLCDVLLQDHDASHGTDTDSLQETSRSLDQRWRTICAMALDRRLRIEETWRLWCKFLDDYSRFEDWLKMAERTAANPNTGDVLYTEAKEELKKFESFQRQVNERLTQLEIVNNQYRRLARENRTDRASQLKAMVQQGNRRWDALHRRVAAILRRLKYFTSQREEFESTRESMLVWLTELDLQLTNVEHFSESDVHHKIQQLNSFQKEIRLNTERIDGLIVFGEGLIQRSAPGDAELIEYELEELHSYCQEVFGRLVRFHHRLSQPPIPVEPESPITSFSLESSVALIGRPWLGRSLSSPLATPTHLLATPLSRSGRETPVSVDSLPLEWDHTGDVGGSSSHEDEEEDDLDDEGAYFSAVSSRSVCDSPRWRTQDDPEFLDLESNSHGEAPPALSSTPLNQGNYLHLMSQCSGSIEDFKRVSLILDDDDVPEEFGLVGLNISGRQSGVIERWELLQAQSQSDLRANPEEELLSRGLDQISSWLDTVDPQLQHVLLRDPPSTVEDMSSQAKQLKEMQKTFAQYKSTMLSLNLNLHGDPDLQQRVALVNQKWSKACTDLQHWDTSLRKTLVRCQEFHETLHSLLLWLAHAESRRYAVDIHHPETSVKALKRHLNMLTDVREELVRRQSQHASLHALWSQLQPEHSDDHEEAQEKLHVTGRKMKVLLRELSQDLSAVQNRLENEPDEQDQRGASNKKSPNSRERREPTQRSFFYRLLRAAFPLHLLLLLLLLMPCLVPLTPPEQSCTGANNFARSFYPMLHYTNGPPPT